MSHQCVFCRIIKGELPASKVYEDEHVVAFMDINPVAKGHALVVPKAHHDLITDTPDEVLARLVAVVRKIARAQFAALRAEGVSVSQANGRAAGQEVPHIHFHVIPRFEASGRHWVPGRYENAAEMQDYAARLSAAVT